MKIQKIFLGLIAVVLFAANANAGRWLTRDPLEFMERDPKPALVGMTIPATRFDYRQQINLYDYVLNNPVNYIDPLGLMGFPTDPDSVSQGIWQSIRAGDWDAAMSAIEDAANVLPEKTAQALSRGINMMKNLDKWRKQMGKLCNKEQKEMLEQYEKTLAKHMEKQGGADTGETMKFRYQIDYLKNLLK